MKSLRLTMPLLALLFVCCKQEENNPSHSVEVIEFKEEDSSIAGFIEGQGSESNFDPAADITFFKQTQFFATPQHELSDNKNAIYCPTLALAWHQIGKTLDKPIVVSDTYPNLQELNNYNGYKGSLKDSEYQTAVEIITNTFEIKASAKFTKLLPFSEPMEVYTSLFPFKGKNVEAFYVWGGHGEYRVNIVDYKNDNDFMVRLNPKDRNHEILLWMPEEKPQSLQNAIEQATEMVETRKMFKPTLSDAWRYKFTEEDQLVIPKIYFNLKSNYPDITNNKFTLTGQTELYNVEEVYQRISFQLDENGAIVESEAEIVATTEEMEPGEKIVPKKMLINKPFLLLLKRRDSKNPYLAVWIENTELLVKK
ncbi:hypothetical protein [Flavobacterium alkalisoli]|uniref:hypothetical protein n=1 Tax=Flavobacterium alkalisoli TaxID=2602769 RepID=UPI003A925F59